MDTLNPLDPIFEKYNPVYRIACEANKEGILTMPDGFTAKAIGEGGCSYWVHHRCTEIERDGKLVLHLSAPCEIIWHPHGTDVAGVPIQVSFQPENWALVNAAFAAMVKWLAAELSSEAQS